MTISREGIAAWCQAHSAEQLALLKELAAIPAPSHQEDLRVHYITNWLKENGADEVYVDGAKNVILPFGCQGRKDLRVYMAHTDVVFPDTQPLPVREEDGFLYAPGVGDDTANVAALMLCAKFLLTEKIVPTVPVLLVFNSCEEGLGNLEGVRQIVKDFAGRIRELISFDCQSDAIVSRAVGSERWRVSVATPGGHSYAAFGSPNAIAVLSLLITRLYSQSIPEIPGATVTYNVGTIQGGTSINTIAQGAEMTYEYRSDVSEGLLFMRNQFQTLLEEAGTDEIRFQAELLGQRPCGANVPEQAQQRLLDRCAKALQEINGQSPSFRSGSTDANIPLSLGIPAATFGLYRGGGAHTREEWLRIDSLVPGLKAALMCILEPDE